MFGRKKRTVKEEVAKELSDKLGVSEEEALKTLNEIQSKTAIFNSKFIDMLATNEKFINALCKNEKLIDALAKKLDFNLTRRLILATGALGALTLGMGTAGAKLVLTDKFVELDGQRFYPAPIGAYDAIVLKDDTYVWAEDRFGRKIAEGEAGVDDANIIQSVLNLLEENHKKIVLLGYFILDKTINLNSNTILDLTSAKIKVKDYAQLTLVEAFPGQPEDQRPAPLIYAKDKTNIEIIGGFIDGNRHNQNQVDKWGTVRHVAIYTHCCENVKIVEVHIKSFATGGIWCKFYEGYDITGIKIVKDCIVEDCGYEPISMTGNKYCIVKGCLVKDSFVPGGDTWNHNITFECSKHCIAVGNILRNLPTGTTGTNVTAIKVDGYDIVVTGNTIDWINQADYSCRGIFAWQGSASPDRVGRVVVTGNTIKMNGGGGLGIYFEGESGYVISQVIISNNIIRGAEYGIAIDYGNNIDIVGNIALKCKAGARLRQLYNGVILNNQFCYNGYFGIYASNMYNSLIENNVIRSQNTGISVIGSENVVILGNILRNHNKYGIEIQSNSSNIYIVENDLTNAGETIILNLGTNTIIKRNKGYTTENSGTITITGDGTTQTFTVDITHGLVSDKLTARITLDRDGTVDKVYLVDKDGDGFKETIRVQITFATAPADGEQVPIYWYAEVV